MNDTIWDIDAPIGRRSVPRTATEVPASGVSWSGPTCFVIREEAPEAFRWTMLSADGRNLKLAQSTTLFPSAEACEQEVRRLEPGACIDFEKLAALPS